MGPDDTIVKLHLIVFFLLVYLVPKLEIIFLYFHKVRLDLFNSIIDFSFGSRMVKSTVVV